MADAVTAAAAQDEQLQVVCVLKSGPEYLPHHVYALARSIWRHNPHCRIRCLTDADVWHRDIETMPLLHNWPGWWSKLELFRPGLLEGPTLYLDLDTVVVGALDIGIDDFTMLPNVYRAGDFGSGCMAWRTPPTHLYETFARSPQTFIDEYTTREKWGDQAFIRDHLGRAPALFDEKFRSYKAHCRRFVPRSTAVVYFHGRPRPWQVQLRMARFYG